MRSQVQILQRPRNPQVNPVSVLRFSLSAYSLKRFR